MYSQFRGTQRTLEAANVIMSYEDKACADAQFSNPSVGLDPNQVALFVGLSLAVSFLCVVMIWPIPASAFNHEGGLIETISAAALFLAGLVALMRYRGISRLYIALVCLLLAERELEADVYTEGRLPFIILDALDTLLDVTAVRIVLTVVILGGILWHGIPNSIRAFKIRAPFLKVFFLAGSVAVLAQLLEELSGIFDESLSVEMAVRLFVMEETLEMYFSIGILAAVLIGWPKSKSEEKQYDQQSRRNPDAR